MNNIFLSAWRSSIVLAALVPACWGQLGVVGGVTSSVGASAGGVLGESAGAAGAPGGAVARQNVFGSLTASQNAALASQLAPLLPASSVGPSSVAAAAAGFHDDTEFMTALHAAHDLNIPFEQLKAKMTGKHSMSLEAAVRKLRPDLDWKVVKENVGLAGKQSERDIARASAAGRKDKVAARVTSDSRLAARVGPLAPQGQSLGDAAAGFKNEDEFLTTLHAANDNGIAFAELKDRVTAGQSVGAAMRGLKPSMDAKASASAEARAQGEAREDRVGVGASASIRATDGHR